VNEACETEEGFNILNAVVVDLKKRLCDAKNCQGNAKEDLMSAKYCVFGPLELH